MIKCEILSWYDSYGTGNFFEDKSRRVSFEMEEERYKRAIALHEAMGRSRYETSKYISYSSELDARHVTEYVYYK